MKTLSLLLIVVVTGFLAAVPAGADVYEQDGYVWPSDKLPIRYRINQGAIPNGVTNAFQLYQQAFDEWSAIPGCALRFEYGGLTFANKAEDGQNVVSIAQRSLGQALAINTLYIDPQGYLKENDIELSRTIRFSTDGSPSTYDLYTVVLHEVGHFLSLDDLYTDVDRQRLMFGQIRVNEVRPMSDLDREDARRFYPEGPPTAPRVWEVAQEDGKNILRWHRSVSGNARGTNIYRSEDGGPATLLEGPITGHENGRWNNRFVDDTIQQGSTYAYTFTSVDAAGNDGPASPPVTLQPGPAPQILMGGLWDSAADVTSGGTLTLAAWVDPVGAWDARVEVLAGDVPTGIFLSDTGEFGDATPGDNLHTLSVAMPPGLTEGMYHFGLQARSSRGVGRIWPSTDLQSVYDLPRFSTPPPVPNWQQAFTQATTPADGPAVYLGGMLEEPFFIEQDAVLQIFAYTPAVGSDLELYLAGQPTGIRFFDNGFSGDFAPNDGIYAARVNFGRRNLAHAGQFLLEIRATQNGVPGTLYPYFSVTP